MTRNLVCGVVVLSALAGINRTSLGERAEGERRGVADMGWASGDQFDAGACFYCRTLAVRAQGLEAAPELRYEPATGRDLRNYPPDRPADLRHMRLVIDIPDMNTPKLTATQTLTFAPLGRPLEVLSLNAEQMQITRVALGGPDASKRPAPVYAYDDHVLSIRFNPPLAAGAEDQIEIDYSLNDPPDGLFWTPEMPEWPGRPAQIHTQGEPNTNRFWFPCHDFPNDRLTTEIIATVPEGYLVSANGREDEKPDARNGRTTFHWLQDKDHAAYLVSMVVGKFDVQDVASAGGAPCRVPLPVYVPPGLGGQIEPTYGRTAQMIKVYERRFGEPYAWDRYAQLLVWNFGAGGMENTSATTMYDTAVLDKKAFLDGDLDGLISHELGHQWFGDLITCNSWAHIWLNEGFATYSTGLWLEERDGHDRGYLDYMHGVMRGLARSDQFTGDGPQVNQGAPGAARGGSDRGSTDRPGMVSPVYKGPWQTFRRTSNPYPKGASILHMLRGKLGDELFFKGLAEYVHRFKHRTPETDDLRKVLEEASGQSLEHFFDQWCIRPGTPKVRVKGEWDEKAKALRLTIEQQQLITPDLPAYTFDLPVVIDTGDAASAKTVTISVDTKRHERTIPLDAPPKMVAVDPNLFVLMDPQLDMPSKWLIEQLQRGPTQASRLDAAIALGAKPSQGAAEALKAVVSSSGEHHRLRSVAADSLGKLSAGKALLALDAAGIDDARARLGVIRALTAVGGPDAAKALARHASDSNESYACRASALEGLGKLGQQPGIDTLAILTAGLKVDSQHEQVRIGAIRGLEALDQKEGLAVVIPFTKLGRLSRLRPEAIDTVSKLAHHDKDAAFQAIAPLVFDREARSQTAAAAALVEMKDKRGLEPLDRLASSARTQELRDQARDWRSALAAGLDADESIRSTKSEIDRLKIDLKRLESQIEKR